MGQMGFFDLGNRYSGLDAKNEPLLKIDGVVPWEDLRARLEAVWRRADKARESDPIAGGTQAVGCELLDVQETEHHSVRKALLPKQRNSREENARMGSRTRAS